MVKKGGNIETNNTIYIIIICVLLVIIICGILFNFIPKLTQNISITNETPIHQPNEFYDVYMPPLRNNPYISPNKSPPFSDKSQDFTQMGIIKYKNNENTEFLPLFGRPLSTSRDKWQYYTLSNKGTLPEIKLNLTTEKGKDLMNEYGAPELYNDDIVMVDGYDKSMQVSLYKQKQLYYI
jgi:hypothetical protein